MTKPAPIYDPEETKTGGIPPSDEVLKHAEQMGRRAGETGVTPPSPEVTEHQKGMDKKALAGAEDQAANKHPDQVGRGYTATSKQNKQKGRKWLFTKRRVALGGGLLGTIVAILMFFTFTSGPLQFIHLSQILQKNFFGTENTSAIRSKGLFRYARNNDIGETRLNKLGSITYRRTLSQLDDIGIKFQRNSLGSPKSMTIDISKNPEYKGMSRSAVRDAIIKDFKITNSNIVSGVVDGKVIVNIDNTSVKGLDFAKSLTRTALGKLDKGKLATAMGFRYLKTAWKLPRLFSPLEDYFTAKKNQIISTAEARKAEKERVKALKSPETTKIALAKNNVKSAINDNAGKIGLALAGTTLLCVVRSVADDVVTVNRALIVLPATIQATDKIAIGSQVQSGQKFDANQLGAVANSFIDENGKTIWEGKALQATAGVASPGGKDLPADYAQAFSNKTTAASIKSAISVKLGGVDVTEFACSKIGLSIQLAAGVALLIAGIPTAGGSWGAYVATQSAILAGSAGAIYLFQQQFHNLIDNKAIVPDVLSGPLGGNLLAYGAREAANVGARGSGGVELSGTETAVLDGQQQLEDQKNFQSKSLANRLFDIYDSRSFASKIIDNSSPSITQNMTKMGSALLNFGHIFSVLPKLFVSPAQAAAQPYNWGFPRYGIPSSLAEDPKYEDPYKNADVVAKLLDADSSNYKGRAKSCFGVNINKDSGVWNVIAQEDVNPNDEDYINANCGDKTENWQRIMLFVFDTRLMAATACYEGSDEQSCTDVGAGAATPGTTAPTPGTPAGTQIVGNVFESSVNIACAPGTTDLDIQDGYSEGALIKFRACALPNLTSTSQESIPGDPFYVAGSNGKAIVNSRVSGAWLALIDASKNAGFNTRAGSSFRTMVHQQALCAANSDCSNGRYGSVAKPGNSSHQLGLAIDFGDIYDSVGGRAGPCNPRQTSTLGFWKWLNDNASKNFGFKQYCAEAWHWDATNYSNRVP